MFVACCNPLLLSPVTTRHPMLGWAPLRDSGTDFSPGSSPPAQSTTKPNLVPVRPSPCPHNLVDPSSSSEQVILSFFRMLHNFKQKTKHKSFSFYDRIKLTKLKIKCWMLEIQIFDSKLIFRSSLFVRFHLNSI